MKWRLTMPAALTLALTLTSMLFASALTAQQYVPPSTCESDLIENVVIPYPVPITGIDREIAITLEIPTQGGVQLSDVPMVVWSHGGAGGGVPSALAEWRSAMARSCYFSVSIGHPWPDDLEPDNQQEALCDFLGLTYPTHCGPPEEGTYKLLNLLRPQDISAVLDYLIANNQGEFDPERIAVAGHSAGAGATSMIAGVDRAYPGPDDTIQVLDLSDPRPQAFMAFSPQGPGSSGFFDTDFNKPDTSWDGVSRPFLIGTGSGDNTCDSELACEADTPSQRAAVYDMLEGSGRPRLPRKYRIFIRDSKAAHSIFGLSPSKCADMGGTIPNPACYDMLGTLWSTAVAFLDSHLKRDRAARSWLRLNTLEQDSGGRYEWDHK